MATSLTTIARTFLGRRGRGYLPSPADERDSLHAWSGSALGGARPAILGTADDLTANIVLRDQGATESCTQHAIDYGVQALCWPPGAGPGGRPYTLRSVAAPYYQGRALNGLQDRDSGAVLRSVLKANQQLGAPSEASWPLRARTINQQPPADTYRLGRPWRGLKFARIEGDLVKGALEALSMRRPVVGGFMVDDAFMQDDGPVEILSMKPSLAGHALLLAGFERTAGAPDSVRFRAPNSWGRLWRDGGWCELGPDVVAGALELWALTGWQR